MKDKKYLKVRWKTSSSCRTEHMKDFIGAEDAGIMDISEYERDDARIL